MTFTTVQKPIKIGTSRGVILPAKELKRLGVEDGDELEIVVRKKPAVLTDNEMIHTANELLERYKQDFSNLAKR